MKFHKDLLGLIFIIIIVIMIGVPQAVNASDQAIIRNVVDGDTLKVFYEGQKESIRLIGIDTPESRKNKKAYKDSGRSGEDIEKIVAMGKESTEYTKSLIKPGDIIKMEFDVQKRDQYKRLLAYVYLNDGRMLNEEIIRAGYASPLTYPPNIKYQDKFLKEYREAREKGRGLFRE
jgi:micrococcal nuclease